MQTKGCLQRFLRGTDYHTEVCRVKEKVEFGLVKEELGKGVVLVKRKSVLGSCMYIDPESTDILAAHKLQRVL